MQLLEGRMELLVVRGLAPTPSGTNTSQLETEQQAQNLTHLFHVGKTSDQSVFHLLITVRKVNVQIANAIAYFYATKLFKISCVANYTHSQLLCYNTKKVLSKMKFTGKNTRFYQLSSTRVRSPIAK